MSGHFVCCLVVMETEEFKSNRLIKKLLIKGQTFWLRRNTSSSSPSTPPSPWVRVLRTGDAPFLWGLPKSGWGRGGSNLCGVLRRECLRPVDEGKHAGVAPFWSGVLGGRFLSKNSGERGAPKRTRFFLDGQETSTSPEGTDMRRKMKKGNFDNTFQKKKYIYQKHDNVFDLVGLKEKVGGDKKIYRNEIVCLQL